MRFQVWWYSVILCRSEYHNDNYFVWNVYPILFPMHLETFIGAASPLYVWNLARTRLSNAVSVSVISLIIICALRDIPKLAIFVKDRQLVRSVRNYAREISPRQSKLKDTQLGSELCSCFPICTSAENPIFAEFSGILLLKRAPTHRPSRLIPTLLIYI